MEHWERWIPESNIPAKLYNDSLIDSKDGIILEFSDEEEKMKVLVKFENGVLSYRNTDEGSLLKTLDYLDQQYGTEFYSEWTFFKVNNSEYINWFLKESLGIYEKKEMNHFVFLTPNDVIEILSTYPPSIIISN